MVGCPEPACPQYAGPNMPDRVCARCSSELSPSWQLAPLALADCTHRHPYHFECLLANVHHWRRECRICSPESARQAQPASAQPAATDLEDNPWAQMSGNYREDQVVACLMHPDHWSPSTHYGNCGPSCPCCRSQYGFQPPTCNVCDRRIAQERERALGPDPGPPDYPPRAEVPRALGPRDTPGEHRHRRRELPGDLAPPETLRVKVPVGGRRRSGTGGRAPQVSRRKESLLSLGAWATARVTTRKIQCPRRGPRSTRPVAVRRPRSKSF